ncbi:unnamed protein product [Symbiodinium sp. CCMP2592]|nr:unnamed protein product [Symbiodinium sp. CCMP2592]
MEMFKDPKGEKLRDLLAKHGDFKSVEVELEKISTQTALNEVAGSWENDISLAAQGWTEVMIANAHRWAASKGLVRTNPVHGLEEIKIPTKESFKFTNEQLQRSKLSGSFEAEDSSGFLFANSVGVNDTLVTNASGEADVNHARVALSAVASGAKEKCLPVLQANQDVFSVLAVYIDMCGKKVDKDKLSSSGLKRGLSSELKPKISEMEQEYKGLLKFQTDAVLDAGVGLRENNDLLSRLARALGDSKKIMTWIRNCQRDNGNGKADVQNWKWFATPGELDLLYKLSAAGRSCSNTCRNLHRLIHRENVTVPVNIDFVNTPVRKRRPVLKKVEVAYPVIYPSSWMKYLLQEHSYLVLGGFDIQDATGWQALLADFWQLHKAYDPGHIMSGHSYCTRFLYTIVPAELYWKDATLDKLNKVDTPLGPTTFHFALVGVKGDWVYLRKEWFNFEMDAPWRTPGRRRPPTPFKQVGSPLFAVPGLRDPTRALVDPAHTWHIGSLGCTN